MATKQLKVCDVTGGTKDVEAYAIRVTRHGGDGSTVSTLSIDTDLSPRGLKRLKFYINKGLTPPKAKAKKATKP